MCTYIIHTCNHSGAKSALCSLCVCNTCCAIIILSLLFQLRYALVVWLCLMSISTCRHSIAVVIQTYLYSRMYMCSGCECKLLGLLLSNNPAKYICTCIPLVVVHVRACVRVCMCAVCGCGCACFGVVCILETLLPHYTMYIVQGCCNKQEYALCCISISLVHVL